MREQPKHPRENQKVSVRPVYPPRIAGLRTGAEAYESIKNYLFRPSTHNIIRRVEKKNKHGVRRDKTSGEELRNGVLFAFGEKFAGDGNGGG